MATFAPISYTYVPTAPRSKKRDSRYEPARKLQHVRSNSTAIDGSRLLVVADSNRGHGSEIQGTGTFCNSNDDNGNDFPTIEEILHTTLQKNGFTTSDSSIENTVPGVEGLALGKRDGSIAHSRSASGDDLGGSLDDPIVLLLNDDSSASEVEAEDVTLRAESAAPEVGLVGSSETAQQLRLAELGASVSDFIRPHNPLSRLSNEPLQDLVDVEGLDTHFARPRDYFIASTEKQLNQESHLHNGQGEADEHGLVRPRLENFPVEEGEREQQEVEQNEDKANDEDEGSQQGMDDVAAVVTAERVGDAHPSSMEYRSPRSAERQQSLSNSDPPLEPSQDRAGSDSCSDDEPNNTELVNEPRSTKRKRPSSSSDGLMYKKRKHRLQRRSTRQHELHPKPHRRSPKSHSPLGQGSRVTAAPGANSQLPSPAPSALGTIDAELLSEYSRSSRDVLPTLTEITFRPQSSHSISFTAIVQEGYDGRGVSFSQLAQLIESIGYVGKIDDFTIKPLQQHSFLVTGLSRHKSARLISTSTNVLTQTKANRIRAVNVAGPVTPGEIEPYTSDESDSDHNSNNDDDGCSSKDEQDRPITRKKIPWDPLDEQRLQVYMKESKSWSWIFKSFPQRTPGAVRTRWSMIQPRG